jgi:cytochrome c oxidase cbb3-type subunit 2
MWAFLRSRRDVALTAFFLLLALDAARSAVGHFGYLAPVAVWRPDPQAYADMTWPPATNVPAGATSAQRLYIENCAFCHGPDGRGNGASAPSMIPRPRDFTQGLFKYKSTLEGAPPSDDDLIAVVANGLNASGMPYFRGILSEEEIRDVVGVVKRFSKAFDVALPPPIAPGLRSTSTPESLARGANLYKVNCAVCHGDDLRGGRWLKDSKGYPVISRDLTAPWTFRGGDAPQQVFLRLSTGLAPAPMPAFVSLSDESRWDLVAFLESKRRTPPGHPAAKSTGRANRRIFWRVDNISSMPRCAGSVTRRSTGRSSIATTIISPGACGSALIRKAYSSPAISPPISTPASAAGPRPKSRPPFAPDGRRTAGCSISGACHGRSSTT